LVKEKIFLQIADKWRSVQFFTWHFFTYRWKGVIL